MHQRHHSITNPTLFLAIASLIPLSIRALVPLLQLGYDARAHVVKAKLVGVAAFESDAVTLGHGWSVAEPMQFAEAEVLARGKWWTCCRRPPVQSASSHVVGAAQRRSIWFPAAWMLAWSRQQTAIAVRLTSASEKGLAGLSGCSQRSG